MLSICHYAIIQKQTNYIIYIYIYIKNNKNIFASLYHLTIQGLFCSMSPSKKKKNITDLGTNNLETHTKKETQENSSGMVWNISIHKGY